MMFTLKRSSYKNGLLGNFEVRESLLNGRLRPESKVEGFTADIGASGAFCPNHLRLPVSVCFYCIEDCGRVIAPYVGHINLGKKGYRVPLRGNVQVTLFNPHGSVVKIFIVRYDVSDMPSNSQTFIRQRTLYMPTDGSENDANSQKWLRYLIHLRFASSKSGRIYLHSDIRLIVFRKTDYDTAANLGPQTFQFREFYQGPTNPRYFSRS
ncbi:Protein FAM214A-like protein [Dinothrombium tinctorium]|uniref:Protein FAM214A-like protein n=1 Tax=Dinothrombium tinctorium TaxID=1965070 RepID=A0A443RLK2_9ACAR|nr:Protein FAM214A-like protein [Dinothrombium tinctorium]